MNKFSIGDRVKYVGNNSGEQMSASNLGYVGVITSPDDNNLVVLRDSGKTYYPYEHNLELITNKTIMTNVKEKFIGLFTKDPEKSYIKAGLMDNDKIATEDGIRIFVSYLMTKSDDFKSEVVDKMLKEEKGDK